MSESDYECRKNAYIWAVKDWFYLNLSDHESVGYINYWANENEPQDWTKILNKSVYTYSRVHCMHISGFHIFECKLKIVCGLVVNYTRAWKLHIHKSVACYHTNHGHQILKITLAYSQGLVYIVWGSMNNLVHNSAPFPQMALKGSVWPYKK